MDNGELIIINNVLFFFGFCIDFIERDFMKGWEIKLKEIVLILVFSIVFGID